jgi:hypothetical protein
MKKRRPEEGEPPTAQGATRMLIIPPCTSDPLWLAEESVEQLKRERPPRVVKTSKKKRISR